jgi:TolA-binding protein
MEKAMRKTPIAALFLLIFSMSLSWAGTEEKDLFRKGQERFQEGKYSFALEIFDDFIGIYPISDLIPDAYYFRAVSLINLHRYREAAKILKKIRSKYRATRFLPYVDFWDGVVYFAFEDFISSALLIIEDESWADWDLQWFETMNLYRAESYWQQNMTDRAEKIYWSLLDSRPETALVALQRLFLIAVEKNDVAVMKDMLNRAEKELPVSLLRGFWFGIGVGSFNKGNRETAEQFLLKIWDLRESETVESMVPLLLSRIYWDRGNRLGAVNILEEYLLLEESAEIIQKRLGDYYRLSGEYENASSAYIRFLTENTESLLYEEAGYHLAFTYYQMNDYKKALEWTHRLMKMENRGAYQKDIHSLNVELLKSLERFTEAMSSLKTYSYRYPEDIRKRLDILRIHFLTKDYSNLLAESYEVKQLFPDLLRQDPYAYLLVIYLEGMALIAKQSYEEALSNFSEISNAVLPQSLTSVLPYSLYYEGWANYKLGNLEESGPLFSNFSDLYPDHELYTQAVYLAGWSYYSLSRYNEALTFFTKLAEYGKGSYIERASFLAGKCYKNLGDSEKAKGIFSGVYKKFPNSSVADDALYEFATIEAEQGKIEAAADDYLSLFKRYPQSPLIEEALYRRGQIYLTNGLDENARDAFYEYRVRFPEGSLVDASLYWGGVASRRLGENFGAVLYWEIIIEEYLESPFRPEAMEKTASVYRESGNYQTALDLLRKLEKDYPDQARRMNVARHIREIGYLIDGKSTREAELSVIIDNEGPRSLKGRKAMIEYVRLMLGAGGTQLDSVEPMLKKILAVDDKSTAMEAQFLLGEYVFRRGDLIRAGNEFLKAALIDPGNKDLAAFSLFRAAEMMAWSGMTKEVEELVDRLSKNFPSSQWVTEGKKLIEELK